MERWTVEEINFLKENHNKMLKAEIAEKLNRTENSVSLKAYKMGISLKRSNYRDWTEEEERYLEDHWGTTSKSRMAKNLNRTKNSITRKANRMGLKDFLHSGEYVTFAELTRALGYNPQNPSFKKQMEKKGCPIKYKKILDKKYAIIHIDEFWKWAERNKGAVNFARLEEGILGEEPTWVALKRKNDINNPAKRTPVRYWTKEEEEKLKFLVKQCRYTYDDIADQLGRTTTAISNKVARLGLKLRPVPHDNHDFWDDEDRKQFKDMYSAGLDAYSISRKLGKSELGVRYKITELEKG